MGYRKRRSIDNALKEDRELRKVSVTELAKRSGIEESVIAAIEAGNHDPSDEERVALSRALGTPLPGVSGEVLQNPNGAVLRLAEHYAGSTGNSFLREIKSLSNRLTNPSGVLDKIAISEVDPKKLKSELLKLQKAITDFEGRVMEA